MALFLDAKAGDTLFVGENKIELVHKSGRRMRLRITGPDDVELVKAFQPAEPLGRELEAANGRGP